MGISAAVRSINIYEGIFYETIPLTTLPTPLNVAYYAAEPRANRVIISIEGGDVRIRWDNNAINGGGHLVRDGAVIEVEGWHTIRKLHMTAMTNATAHITYER
ncbi:MAG: hypothetical protein ACOYWZ_15020 [Bacillota bacterium]